MIDSLGERLAQLFGADNGRHRSGGAHLFYRVKLTSVEGADRGEYTDRAEELRREINDELVNTGRFTNFWISRTRDPYIILDDRVTGTYLTDGDERVRDGTDDEPLPDDVAFDPDNLVKPPESVEDAQQAVRNVVLFEIIADGSARNSDFGDPAPVENVRELIRPFSDHEDVAEIERLYPFPDERTYGFVHRNHEVRVKAVVDNGWPHTGWEVGPPEERGKGAGWVGVVGDEEYGLSNGRLYFDERRNEQADKYIDRDLGSIPMPEPIAENLLADARKLQDEAAVERRTPDRGTTTTDETNGSEPSESAV